MIQLFTYLNEKYAVGKLIPQKLIFVIVNVNSYTKNNCAERFEVYNSSSDELKAQRIVM